MSRLGCSFCGKSESESRQIVAGPNRVGVCRECVVLFGEITRDTFAGDVLVTGIGELTTNDPLVPGLVGIIEHAALAVTNGTVVWAGPSDTLPARFVDLPELNVEGRAVIPGFCDPHTHAVFGGDRADDYVDQLALFADIPLTSVTATVAATGATSDTHLVRETKDRLSRMLTLGTTTVEAKSGYGGSVGTERRILGALDQAAGGHAIDVVPTLHLRSVPSGADRSDYVDMAVNELIPLCAPLATYCDVYCDASGFSPDEAIVLLEAAHEYGLPARIHAQRFEPDTSVLLAVSAGAVTADHLDHITRADADRIAEAGTIAVLLPAASFGTRSGHAPARMLWESGATVAIGSDCSPEGLTVESMQMVVALATIEMGLTASQAIWAATRGGALAVEEPEKGWLGRGSAADFVVLDAPRASHLVQRAGTNLAWKVFKDGRYVAG